MKLSFNFGRIRISSMSFWIRNSENRTEVPHPHRRHIKVQLPPLSPNPRNYQDQRVLNDLKRNRLSRGRMFWLLLHPPSPTTVKKIDRRHAGKLRKRDKLLKGGGGGGATSYDGEESWFSINHSILSDQDSVFSLLRFKYRSV